MKLNIGSGVHYLEGYVNCDLEPGADIVCDCSRPLPFEDESIDEIASFHFLEHLYRWEADDVLRDWYRLLKPDGRLVLELPSLDKILKIYEIYLARKIVPEPELSIFGLYGDPRLKDPSMTHRWCWHSLELKGALEMHGFVDVQIMAPTTHRKHRDMRQEARKP